MNLSEDQLRTELHDSLAATGPGLPAISAADVVSSGSRIVRRRRIAATSATATVAAVVAIGLGATLGGDSARTEVVGSLTTSNRVTVDGSATLTLTGTRVAGGTEATEFVVRIGPRAVPPAKAVTMIPPGDVGFYAKDASGALQYIGGSTTDGLGRRATLGHAGSDVVLGIVPDDAVDVGLLPGHDGGTGGSSQDEVRRIPGTGYSAFAFRLNDVPRGDAAEFQVMWWRADGTPVTNDGAGSAVRFGTSTGDYGLWALPGADLVGYRAPGGGGTTLLSNLYSEGVGDFDATRDYVEDSTKTPATTSGHLVHLYVVRGRVGDVGGTYSSAVVDAAPLQSRYLPAVDGTVVLASARLPEAPVSAGTTPPLLTRLTWTDAKGAAQSHDVR